MVVRQLLITATVEICIQQHRLRIRILRILKMPTNFKNKIRSETLHTICELCHAETMHRNYKACNQVRHAVFPFYRDDSMENRVTAFVSTNFYEFLRILKIT